MNLENLIQSIGDGRDTYGSGLYAHMRGQDNRRGARLLRRLMPAIPLREPKKRSPTKRGVVRNPLGISGFKPKPEKKDDKS